ncbi:SH3 domain-containing protein [Pandoraea sp. PE-S2R-1]|uniref:SH3 domain-containing protein n=1 Tax=Pandoraea sp. PE-S2R-1 TaxID=1986994 RepID=UPI000B4056AE|nr:SH3 domain-containing protein [Pandoraea sp. PE-S2R-1]
MNKSFLPLVITGAATVVTLAALPGVASAQASQAVINSPANVRAGPASDYPVVSQAGPGMPVTVYGCLSDYTWCDIGLPGSRGWIYAALLSYPYQGSPVPVLNYGTMIGLPIVTFSIGAYWGNYYRGRPWYNDQRYWHRPPPRPRPPQWGGGPGPRPPGGHYPGPGPRPPGHGHGAGPGPRPPGHGAGPGPRPPGHGAGPGPGRPPGHGAGPGPRPPGGGGGHGPRPPGGGGGGHGGGNGGGHGGGGGGHGGGGGGRPGGDR